MERTGVSAEVAKRVHALVSNYVYRKSEEKSGLKWDDFKDRRDDKRHILVPEKYRDAREKVCADAFLSMRSRRSREEFIAYFTGAICSVPQYLPEADYLGIANAFWSDEEGWEEIKALAMLTLSSLSRA